MDKTDIAEGALTAESWRAPNGAVSGVHPRGPLSNAILGHCTVEDSEPRVVPAHLREAAIQCVERSSDVMADDDLQLSLFLLYSLAYGSFQQWGDQWEWDPVLIEIRTGLEDALEAHLRRRVDIPSLPGPHARDVAAALFALTAPGPGPSLSRYVATKASLDQLRETIVIRTIYTLREADPHSWAIPRMTGRVKAALVEIQADEYGGGDVDRVHAHMFATTVRALGLDATYGAYVNQVPAVALASHNLMSLFGLNRRLRGAIIGHLAAYEMTSTLPCRNYGNGMRRLGLGPEATAYFDEHVEADAVHEQIAGHDLAGSLAEDEPALIGDIFLGAASHLYAESLVEARMLDAWSRGESGLRNAASMVRVA